MKEKLCSLTIIASMVLQIFVSTLPGEMSGFSKENSQSQQTFIDSASTPFVAVISSQRAKQIRYHLDSLSINIESYVHVLISDQVHFRIKKTGGYVRSQINHPLLI